MLGLGWLRQEARYLESLTSIRGHDEYAEIARLMGEAFDKLIELAANDRWRDRPEALREVLDVAERCKANWRQNGRVA